MNGQGNDDQSDFSYLEHAGIFNGTSKSRQALMSYGKNGKATEISAKSPKEQ